MMNLSKAFLYLRCHAASRCFTLIEMLVVVAIIAVLAALGLPQMNQAFKKSQQAKSVNNLRALGVGLASYLAENDNQLPHQSSGDFKSNYWSQTILPYLPKAHYGGWKDVRGNAIYQSDVLMDPLLKDWHHQSLGDYACNNALFINPGTDPANPKGRKSMNAVGRPTSIVTILAAGMIFNGKEAGSWYLDSNFYVYGSASQFPSDRGMNGVICLFADGHTESIPRKEFDKNKAQLLLPD